MGLAEDIGGSFAATGQRLGVKDAMLIKVAPGVRIPGDITSGTQPIETNYPCKGYVSTFDAGEIDGSLIQKDDRRISLFSSTLEGAEPRPDDKISIEGSTYRVVLILERDPASVMFTCQGRL